ncbi:uncharacterized protein LOC110419543 [Herrania umbratica]|uniref:Uncharacterized protein LOC110419543 n=1 Tax=Herrania umbratica TaxID=108875 RepID=A0A6J1AMY5_9ROSI|nr:uncharacterized protein LOC110419543 [Herrania umbratica]
MAKEHSHSIFQLSRDEKLICPKDRKTLVRTARFLKPCVQTVSRAVTVPNTPLLFDIFSQNLKQWPENIDIKGWHVSQKRWEEWVDRMAGQFGALWNLTGICDAIMSSRYEIRCNKVLILGLVEFWCSETNTFVFPWGEATVTLEDVMILGGFSTLGESVRRPLEGKSVKIEEELNRKRLIMSRNKSRKATYGCWIEHFMEEEREYEHVAFLSLWLSRVAMQFGSDQDLPAAFPVCSMSWENARFTVPPRSFEPCASVRYFNWWIRSKLARTAALRDVKRMQNRSSQSVLAKRNVEKSPPSIEFGVKKPKTLVSKLSTKAETEGCCSSFANEYAAKTGTQMIRDYPDEHYYQMCSLRQKIEPHVLPPVWVERTEVNSKGLRAMCSLKTTDSFSQVSADNNSKESHASVNSELLSSKIKRQAYKAYDDTERLQHVSGTPNKRAGLRKASPCCQYRTTGSPTSIVANGNLRKRKFSFTIAGRSKAATLPVDGTAEGQTNAGGSDQKLKRIVKEGRKAVDVTEHKAGVEWKKRFEGSLKGIGKESKTRMVEGFHKNSENVTIKDTISGSLLKFGLELEGRLRRVEKLAGISPK